MRKLILLMAAFAFSFVSCSRDELIPDFTESEQVEDVRTKSPKATSNSDDDGWDGWDDNKKAPDWKNYQLPNYGQGASSAKGTPGSSRWPSPTSSSDSSNSTGEENSPNQVASITVKLTATTGGYVIGSGNYYMGANVHCVAVPDPGYCFVRWSGVLSGYDSDVFISANVSFSSQAVFRRK